MTVVSSPVIALNHAVAVAMSRGLEEGLRLLEDIGASGELAAYRAFYTTRAELLRRLGRHAEALPNYERALGMTSNEVERRLLTNRIASLRTQAKSSWTPASFLLSISESSDVDLTKARPASIESALTKTRLAKPR
jgi:hypothetical protein